MIAVVPIVPVPENKTSPTSKFDRLLQSFKAKSFILSVLSVNTILPFCNSLIVT